MPCGVGVIGAGTVGGGVIEVLLTHGDVIANKAGVEVALRHVAELDLELLKPFSLEGVRTSADAGALLSDPDVDVVCELIGGLEPAKSFILEALAAGKHVVTANKMLVATHGPELTRAALANGVALRYEAAVAGAIPIIKSLREGLVANEILALYGILNGTCNYILSRMTFEGPEFDDALGQAMELGFAETPPDLDIGGQDTAHKCQILASLCYSSEVDLAGIYVEGVTNVTHLDVEYAREMGYQIKLLATIRKIDGEIDARVHPALVPESHLLASVRNEFNAIYVEGDVAGATMYYGPGAGRLPTASAVVADVADIARGAGSPAAAPFHYHERIPLRDIGRLESRYYLRLTTQDHPGVLGAICTVLGEHDVSIASCFQKEEQTGTPAHVVIMTHAAIESKIRAALAKIDALPFIAEPTHVIRAL